MKDKLINAAIYTVTLAVWGIIIAGVSMGILAMMLEAWR